LACGAQVGDRSGLPLQEVRQPSEPRHAGRQRLCQSPKQERHASEQRRVRLGTWPGRRAGAAVSGGRTRAGAGAGAPAAAAMRAATRGSTSSLEPSTSRMSRLPAPARHHLRRVVLYLTSMLQQHHIRWSLAPRWCPGSLRPYMAKSGVLIPSWPLVAASPTLARGTSVLRMSRSPATDCDQVGTAPQTLEPPLMTRRHCSLTVDGAQRALRTSKPPATRPASQQDLWQSIQASVPGQHA